MRAKQTAFRMAGGVTNQANATTLTEAHAESASRMAALIKVRPWHMDRMGCMNRIGCMSRMGCMGYLSCIGCVGCTGFMCRMVYVLGWFVSRTSSLELLSCALALHT